MARSKRRRTASTRPSATSSTTTDPAAEADLEGEGMDAPDSEADASELDVEAPEADAELDAFDGFEDEIAPPPRRRRPAEPVRRSARSGASATRGTTAASTKGGRSKGRTTTGDADDAPAGKDPARRKPTPRTVPDAAKDSRATETARARRAAEAERTRTTRRRVAAVAPNPAWLAPTAVTLLLLGLVYLVTYYLSSATLPLPIGDWNLLAGFGIMILGGALLMRWR